MFEAFDFAMSIGITEDNRNIARKRERVGLRRKQRDRQRRARYMNVVNRRNSQCYVSLVCVVCCMSSGI